MLCLLTVLLIISGCSSSSGLNSTSTDSSTAATAPVNSLHSSVDYKNYYSDSSFSVSDNIYLVNSIQSSLKSSDSIPDYSQTLSQLANFVIGDMKTLSPFYMYELSPHFGITAPWIFQSWMNFDKDVESTAVVETILHFVKNHNITHFGLAVKENKKGKTLLLLTQKRSVHFSLISKFYAMHSKTSIEGIVSGEFKSIEVAITDSTGKSITREINLSSKNYFKLALSVCEKKDISSYRFQFMASNSNGASLVADFPLVCGKKNWPSVPEKIYLGSEKELGETRFSEILTSLLNTYRKNNGLPEFISDKTLTAVSENHSRDMCSLETVLHISPNSGRPEDRLKKYQVKATTLGENVASGYTPEEIIKGWLSSKTHRMNIIIPGYKKAGVGVCRKNTAGGTYTYYVTLSITGE